MTLTTPPRSRTRNGAAFWEAGTGEPLVFLHGVGTRLENCLPLAESFLGSHRVIAIDMAGHGESDRLDDRSRLPDFVDWLADVLQDINCGPANIVGHSMGALIGLGLTIECPAAVLRLALLNCVFRRSDDARAAVMARARMIADEASPLEVEEPLARWFGAAESSARDLTRSWLRAADRRGYAIAYRAFAEGDAIYADRIHQILCPTLFMTGSEDPNSLPAMTKDMGRAVRGAAAVVIPGHGHMLPLTASAHIVERLRALLAQPVSQNLVAGIQ